MTLARWAAVATLAAAFHLPAQSPAPTSPPPPATGPTMEQSFAFINDAFTKQGNVSYKVTGGPCLDFQTWEIRNLAVWLCNVDRALPTVSTFKFRMASHSPTLRL